MPVKPNSYRIRCILLGQPLLPYRFDTGTQKAVVIETGTAIPDVECYYDGALPGLRRVDTDAIVQGYNEGQEFAAFTNNGSQLYVYMMGGTLWMGQDNNPVDVRLTKAIIDAIVLADLRGRF